MARSAHFDFRACLCRDRNLGSVISFRSERFGIGVGSSNLKIGLGDGTGIEGADGAIFEIGTPDPVCWLAGGVVVRSIGWPSRSTSDDLANQSIGL